MYPASRVYHQIGHREFCLRWFGIVRRYIVDVDLCPFGAVDCQAQFMMRAANLRVCADFTGK
jgi:hypothetical protein